MASISANGARGYHKYTLNVTQSATSVANNTSTLSFEFKLSPIYTSWNWEGWNQSISYTVTINGTNYTGYIPDYDGYSVVTLKSGTQSVSHNADGTKSISYSFSVTDGANQYYTSGNASSSGTMTLTTIPRATTPTFSAKSVTMGNSITITMNPASTTFKHKLRYSWSTLTQQVSGFSAGDNFTAQGNTTATFTPPTSLANYIPSASSGACTVQCYTYDANGNHIGTVETDITLAVPSYTPTGSIAITGNSLLSSTYVQGKSTMGVSVTASSSYGASISSYSSVVDGKTYAGNSFTTSALSNGSKSVVTTITDSRGKTAQITSSSVTVYEYASPKITSFTLARQSDNTTVIATVKGSISSVNSKNAKTIKVVLNGVTNTITSSSYTINGTTTFTSVPTDTTLIGSATLTDSFTTVKQDSVLPTVAVTMDFYKDGKGVAFGKVAETTDLLDVAWSERVRKNLTVNGTATVDGHTYSKYNLYVTGHLYMGGEKSQSGEKFIRFSNPDASTNPHNVCIYGGDASNTTAFGFYDTRKSKNFFTYKDVSDIINIGTGASTLNINGNNVADYITEEGGSGAWWYRKWNGGDMEVFGTVSQTPTSLNNGTNSITATLPVSFVDTSFVVNITPAKCGLMVSAFGDCNSSNDKTHTVNSFILSYKYNYSTAYTVNFNVTVVGKWK